MWAIILGLLSKPRDSWKEQALGLAASIIERIRRSEREGYIHCDATAALQALLRRLTNTSKLFTHSSEDETDVEELRVEIADEVEEVGFDSKVTGVGADLARRLRGWDSQGVDPDGEEQPDA